MTLAASGAVTGSACPPGSGSATKSPWISPRPNQASNGTDRHDLRHVDVGITPGSLKARTSSGRGRAGDRNLRRRLPVRLNLDERQLPCAPLAEGRGRKIGGEHVRIPVTAEPRVGRVWVVLGPGGQLGDPGSHCVIHRKPGQARPPVVEDPHEVTVTQPAG